MADFSRIADDLERLCCAETEGKFFDYVTDSITDIIAGLRTAAQSSAVNVQRDSDIGILLSALRMHEEAVGESFDDDGGNVAQIEADYRDRVGIHQDSRADQ